MRHVADDCLSTFVHRDVLHRDPLLTSGAVSLERLDLSGERARELVEDPMESG